MEGGRTLEFMLKLRKGDWIIIKEDVYNPNNAFIPPRSPKDRSITKFNKVSIPYGCMKKAIMGKHMCIIIIIEGG